MSSSTRLTVLALVASVLLAGCVQAYVKPPYAGEPASKAQCQNGSTSDECKKAQSN